MKMQAFITAASLANVITLSVIFLVPGGKCCWFDQFECELTKNCLNRDQVRNGRANCGANDTSDEDFPLLRCHPRSEFRCRVNGQCIGREFINRGIAACHDLSDGGSIINFPCIRNEEIKCSSGNCVALSAAETMSDCSLEIQKYQEENTKDCAVDCKDLKPTNCSKREFRCANQKCIPRHQVGDKYKDCDNDEEQGLITTCNEDEFTCKERNADGSFYIRCIPRSWINDGLAQCDDGSDEKVTSLTCYNDEWSCDGGTKCLQEGQLCDGVPDCLDCSDETNSSICSHENSARFFTCQKPIGLGEKFTNVGVSNSHCVLRSYFCDGVIDCADKSDELSVGSGFKCRITKTNREILWPAIIVAGRDETRLCILPSFLLHDGLTDCDDGSDEMINDTSDGIQHFSCSLEKNSRTIKYSQVCDGVFDCRNLVDECLCVKESPSFDYDIAAICDNICYNYTTSIKSNDLATAGVSTRVELSEACKFCSPKTLLCFNETQNETKNFQCVAFDQICDGNKDCYGGEDELFCREESSADKPTDELSLYKCPMSTELLVLQSLYAEEIPDEARRCDGRAECAGLGDECDDVTDDDSDAACRLRKQKPEYCQHFTQEWWLTNWNPGVWQSQLCDGIGHWENNLDEKYCGDTRFYCKTTNTSDDDNHKISIEIERVCDGYLDCSDQSDELNCLNHFYCLYSNHPLFVSRNKVLDGISDCADGSDECPDPNAFEDDPLSSRDQLIKFPAFYILIWLIGLLAAVGNTVVFASTLKRVLLMQFDTALCSPIEICLLRNKQGQCQHSKSGTKHYCSPLAKCNDMLVLNLALADFLTGLYLLIIAIKSSIYSGSYCSHEMEWRSSTECESMGSLIFIASVASVLTLAVLSSYRLCATLKPWKMKQCRVKVSIFWIVLIWIFSISVGLLPRATSLNDVFVTSLHLKIQGGTVARKPVFFSSHAVSKNTMSTFLARACVLFSSAAAKTPTCTIIVNGNSEWSSLTDTLHVLFNDIRVSGYFGYFSHHGVCLPAMFQSNLFSSGSVIYTSLVMGLVLLLFLYIAFAYSVICYKSSKLFQGAKKAENSEGVSKNEAKKVANMHRRIARLVLTDFICWTPICIISFCSLAGTPTPPWLYSFVIVFLLPINSALNPLLYSDVISTLLASGVSKLQFKRPLQTAELCDTSLSNNINMSPIIKEVRNSQESVGRKNKNRCLSVHLNKEFKERSSFSKQCSRFCSRESTSKDKKRKTDARSFSTLSPSETVTTYISTNATTPRKDVVKFV